MTNTEMNPGVADAVRAELAAIGTKSSRLQRHQRLARGRAIGIAAVIVVGLTTGAAIVASSFPGSTTVNPLGGVHIATQTGTGQLELGPAPAHATRVILTVHCLRPEGTISITALPQSKGAEPGFGSFYCSSREMIWHMNDASLPDPGTTSITITADPGTAWTVTGQYASSATTPWGQNARGQTYGQCNVNGCPDLVGAQATNGNDGFVLAKQWASIRGSGYIPVYDSDGRTVIGQFAIGIPGQQ